MTNQMPGRKAFAGASKALKAVGWAHIATIAADDAKQDGVTNFGMMFTRPGETFYLNYKTITSIPFEVITRA